MFNFRHKFRTPYFSVISVRSLVTSTWLRLFGLRFNNHGSIQNKFIPASIKKYQN